MAEWDALKPEQRRRVERAWLDEPGELRKLGASYDDRLSGR